MQCKEIKPGTIIDPVKDISFHDFEDVLAVAGSLADAAEAHGCLCGALCAIAPFRMQDWLNEVLPDGGVLAPAPMAVLERVYQATTMAFGEHDMQFAPLLPDDDQPIAGRASALGAWCTGFLYGLGTGQLADLRSLPGDVGEIVRDFAQISQASGAESATDESNEQAYVELVEFIRVGAQVVFEELLPMRENSLPMPDSRLH
jgi:uncharacterized protein YgfB (UPF0149 family)